MYGDHTWGSMSDPKIDQKSRQNFILNPRFPRESCRSRRDLQLSLENLGLRIKFCLGKWSRRKGDRMTPATMMKMKGRFPRESCRSRRDLQLSLGNLPLRMKFCLEFWSMKVGFGPIQVDVWKRGRFEVDFSLSEKWKTPILRPFFEVVLAVRWNFWGVESRDLIEIYKNQPSEVPTDIKNTFKKGPTFGFFYHHEYLLMIALLAPKFSGKDRSFWNGS